MNIIAYRHSGNVAAPSIVEPLLGESIAAALQRGRNELDVRAEGLQESKTVTRYLPGLELGKLISFDDTDTGKVEVGKIKSISHTISPSTRKVSTSLTLQRKTSDFSV